MDSALEANELSWEDVRQAIADIAASGQIDFTPSMIVHQFRATNRLPGYSSEARNRVAELLREKEAEGMLCAVRKSRYSLADDSEKNDRQERRVSEDASDDGENDVNQKRRVSEDASDDGENDVNQKRRVSEDASDDGENDVNQKRRVSEDASDDGENDVNQKRRVSEDASDDGENDVNQKRRVSEDASHDGENDASQKRRVSEDASDDGENVVYEQIRQQLSCYFRDSSDDFIAFHADLIAELRRRDLAGNRTKINLFVEGSAAAGKSYYIKKLFAVARQFVPSLQNADAITFLPHIWIHQPQEFNERFSSASMRALDETHYFLQWQPSFLATVMEHSNNDDFPQGSRTAITIVSNYEGATSNLVGLNEGFLRRINFVIRLPAPSSGVLASRFIATMRTEYGILCDFSNQELSATATFKLAIEFYGGGLAFKVHLRATMEVRRQRRQQQQQQRSHKELPLHLLCDVLIKMMKEDFVLLQQVVSPNERVLQMIDAARRSGILAEHSDARSEQRVEPTHRGPQASEPEDLARSEGQVGTQLTEAAAAAEDTSARTV